MLAMGTQAQVWQPLDGGLERTPTAITSHANLIVTAHVQGFDKGYRVHKISVWNGFYWQELPPIYADSNSYINALKFYKGALYIGGKINEFKDIDGAKHIIRWSNREYQKVTAVNSNLSNFLFVDELAVFDNQLVISGPFTASSANYGENLAFFNGVSVLTASNASFGSGIKGSISTIFANENLLILGGRITKANDTATANLAIYHKNQWQRLSNNIIVPKKAIGIGSNVYFSGYNTTSKEYGFYKVNGSQIDTINQGLDEISNIYDIVEVGGKIYASGQFKIPAKDNSTTLIVFQNGKWEEVDNGNLLGLRLLANHKDYLIGTGFFIYHNLIRYDRIARYLPEHGIISGKIFFDKDKNCAFNSRDEQLNEMNVLVTPGPRYIKPLEDGTYFSILPKGEYDIRILKNKIWEVVDCGTEIHQVNLAKGQVQTGLNFPMIQKTGIRDLAIKLTSASGLTVDKNSDVSYRIQFVNNGSENVAQTQVVLKFDSKLVDIKAEPSPAVIGGDSAVWTVEDLFAGEQRQISISFGIQSSADAFLNLVASIPLQEDEEITIDNESSLLQSLGEEDYEFKKEIFPTGSDTAYIQDSTESIEYQISFANYTTDTIHNVYVIDTIKLNHSLSIIQTTGASHPVSSEAFTGLPGEDLGIIVWSFKDIDLLPNPSNNPEIVAHKGFVSFRIGLNQGMSEGTVLTNRAQVVFDYYEQEATNPVWAMVSNQLASVEPMYSAEGLEVYPNPTRGLLHLALDKNDPALVQIYSLEGRLLKEQVVEDQSIDLSDLPNGLYILRAVQDHIHMVQKVVKW